VIAGEWLFGSLTCDVFNANDVLFSTASLLHLCCISWDRYIAVTDPFNYDRRMTRRRAALTLAGVWTASAALSHIPIHLGLYTTASQRHKLAAQTNECSFKVRRHHRTFEPRTLAPQTPILTNHATCGMCGKGPQAMRSSSCKIKLIESWLVCLLMCLYCRQDL